MYESIRLKQVFVIQRVTGVYYFEGFARFEEYEPDGNPWHLLYIDSGQMYLAAREARYLLKSGDIIFCRPGELYPIEPDLRAAPNLAMVSFVCQSHEMHFFGGRVFTAGETERRLLAWIVGEARNWDLPDAPFGSEQLVRGYIEELLILLRRGDSVPAPFTLSQSRDELHSQILGYLRERLQSHVTLDQICRDNLIGRSHLQRIIRERDGCGVIDLFCRMKIDRAKQLIRDNHMNFTQIAYYLGYASVHYFSRQFKQITGLSPSQYATSIRRLTDRAEKGPQFEMGK